MFYSIRFQESPGKKKERERAGEKTGPTGNQFGSEGEHTTVALLIDEGHVRSFVRCRAGGVESERSRKESDLTKSSKRGTAVVHRPDSSSLLFFFFFFSPPEIFELKQRRRMARHFTLLRRKQGRPLLCTPPCCCSHGLLESFHDDGFHPALHSR